MASEMDKIKGGYYIKARKIQNSEISHYSPAVREIWDWLLMNANHKNSKNGRIKRGQLFINYNDIRDGLKWKIGYRTERYSEDVTKKAMMALRRLLMITTMKAPGGVLISICNYDFYQNPKNYDGTNEAPTAAPTAAPSPHQGGTIYNNKNVKNVKNESKDLFGTTKEIVPEPSNGKVLDEDIDRILKPFPSLQLVRTNDMKNVEFWECYNGEHGLLWTYFKDDGDAAETWLVRQLTEIDKWQRITKPQKASKSAAGLRNRITTWLGKEFDKLEARQ